MPTTPRSRSIAPSTSATAPITFAIAMRTRFRGITERQGMVWRGDVGWAEWSPFLDYGGDEIVPWWTAACEAADQGWPEPVRTHVPVNCTVPAVGPEAAHRLVSTSGCATAKVKVCEPGQDPTEDLARVEAVRDALGPSGHLRVDANGGWDVDEADRMLRLLARFDLEYAEQPCAAVADLASLRRRLARSGVNVLVAADESIRRAEDPYEVARCEAADVAVLKVQPLGGVRACLEIAERIGLPVVVSSALETSIGIRAGLALAGALPELPYACGLNTVPLLTDDLVAEPLIAVDGQLSVAAFEVDGQLSVAAIEVDTDALQRCAADEATDALWQARLMQVRARAESGRG